MGVLDREIFIKGNEKDLNLNFIYNFIYKNLNLVKF